MNMFKHNLQQSLKTLVDTILPPRCVVTGEVVDQQGMLDPAAWANIEFIAEPQCKHCGIPFEFNSDGDLLCASCSSHPPSYDKARAALIYNDTSKQMILGFKHGDKMHVALSFVPWLLKAGAPFWNEADIIMPVSLHRSRLMARRYNQAAVMIKALEKHVQCEVILDGLKRLRATPPQGHMKFGERQKNVRNAFVVNKTHQPRIQGKTIVLVDDVLTTGATVEECTKALKKAGAQKVFILTLARVLKS